MQSKWKAELARKFGMEGPSTNYKDDIVYLKLSIIKMAESIAELQDEVVKLKEK